MMMLHKYLWTHLKKKNIIDMYKKFKFPKDMIMTIHDELVYDNSTNFNI